MILLGSFSWEYWNMRTKWYLGVKICQSNNSIFKTIQSKEYVWLKHLYSFWDAQQQQTLHANTMMNKLPKYWAKKHSQLKNILSRYIFIGILRYTRRKGRFLSKPVSTPLICLKLYKVKSKDCIETTYTVFQICNSKMHWERCTYVDILQENVRQNISCN